MQSSISFNIEESWFDYMSDSDFLSRNCIGYWAYIVAYEPKVDSWLIYDYGEEDRRPTASEIERAESLWRDGLELPKNFFNIDQKAKIGIYCEGVKYAGTDWFKKSDQSLIDRNIQNFLFKRTKYA